MRLHWRKMPHEKASRPRRTASSLDPSSKEDFISIRRYTTEAMVSRMVPVEIRCSVLNAKLITELNTAIVLQASASLSSIFSRDMNGEVKLECNDGKVDVGRRGVRSGYGGREISAEEP